MAKNDSQKGKSRTKTGNNDKNGGSKSHTKKSAIEVELHDIAIPSGNCRVSDGDIPGLVAYLGQDKAVGSDVVLELASAGNSVRTAGDARKRFDELRAEKGQVIKKAPKKATEPKTFIKSFVVNNGVITVDGDVGSKKWHIVPATQELLRTAGDGQYIFNCIVVGGKLDLATDDEKRQLKYAGIQVNETAVATISTAKAEVVLGTKRMEKLVASNEDARVAPFVKEFAVKFADAAELAMEKVNDLLAKADVEINRLADSDAAAKRDLLKSEVEKAAGILEAAGSGAPVRTEEARLERVRIYYDELSAKEAALRTAFEGDLDLAKDFLKEIALKKANELANWKSVVVAVGEEINAKKVQVAELDKEVSYVEFVSTVVKVEVDSFNEEFDKFTGLCEMLEIV
ncbi:MAG: hypothetical protein GY861_20745 [bacterium]|nr:hypothetical protein [bacterium]